MLCEQPGSLHHNDILRKEIEESLHSHEGARNPRERIHEESRNTALPHSQRYLGHYVHSSLIDVLLRFRTADVSRRIRRHSRTTDRQTGYRIYLPSSIKRPSRLNAHGPHAQLHTGNGNIIIRAVHECSTQ